MPPTPRSVGPRLSPSGKRTSADGASKKPPAPRREAPLVLEIVIITPELAQEWLDRGGTNPQDHPPSHRGHASRYGNWLSVVVRSSNSSQPAASCRRCARGLSHFERPGHGAVPGRAAQ